MRRTLTSGRLVVATHNPGKLAEIRELLGPHGVEAVSAASLGISEPHESEATFAGNARLKAVHSAKVSGLPALSDDSGLCVDALGGEPGVHSARWAGAAKDFALAMRNVEEKLQAKGAVTPDARKAHFVCALCLAWPDGHGEIFEGRVDGTLVWPPRGSKGFGYDPMFVPGGLAQTFGEMEPEVKHTMSHRARAFGKLIDAVF
ncbi:MAG: RdgB/HAM1 family non-canonical purine NTP pyrophosphatase [Hyphomicrobiales bacterium]